MLNDAALGPDMTLATMGAATLGVQSYDTSFAAMMLSGLLAIDTSGGG